MEIHITPTQKHWIFIGLIVLIRRLHNLFKYVKFIENGFETIRWQSFKISCPQQGDFLSCL